MINFFQSSMNAVYNLIVYLKLIFLRLLSFKFSKIKIIRRVKARKISNLKHQVFFGYYDLIPFSSDETMLLALHAPVENKTPEAGNAVKVGFYLLHNKEANPFFELGETTTWCWQQGCRLQWYPANSNQYVLYNRLVDENYGSVIQDIQSKAIVKSYKRPVYSVSPDGQWALSLNFSRLQRLRPGYGYVNYLDETEGQLTPKGDGVWRIDMKTGKEDLLFSVAEIAAIEPLASMAGAEHYFNHILFNPAGSRFMFFHLWMKNGKRYIRLITCNIDGHDKYALVNEGHVSHYCWKSRNELLAFSTHADTGMHYHLYKDKSQDRVVIGQKVLKQDGHPSFSPDGLSILTDTYPDKYREQHLMLFELKSGTLVTLGKFYCQLKYQKDVRCDLHPRWSPSGRYICIDSACEGGRAMYLLTLGNK